MTEDDLKALGYAAARQLPDGRWLAIQPQMFTIGLFIIRDGDRYGYECRYCYQSMIGALTDWAGWDGRNDPPGAWIKQKPQDRLNPRLADPEADFC